MSSYVNDLEMAKKRNLELLTPQTLSVRRE